MTETDKQPMSLIIAWDYNDHDSGSYSWSGLASDIEDALEQAKQEAIDDNGYEKDELEGQLDFVILEETGVNIFAAPEMLSALKAAEEQLSVVADFDKSNGGGDTDLHQCLANVRLAIAHAECREAS